MKICEDLRRAVLQAAIQGKLTEQRAEDGTAEDLLKKIKKEKAKLIAEGKIKKEKALPPIKDDEKPFDIPENWAWVRLGEIFQHNTGKALNSSDNVGKPWEYITTSNVYWNRFELIKLKKMLFTETEIEKCTVQKGDLLVLEGGDVGRAAIWNYDFPMRIQNHIHRLRAYITMKIEYFYYIFFLYKNSGLINGKGIGIQGLSANVLHSLIIPFPPLAEQERIVEHVDALMSKIDELEKVENELEAMKKNFPGDLRDALLQAAIQGKLTEQRAEDGTAEDLLKEIKKEKAKLIAEGKIKKEKALPPIEDDEKLFDIPENWIWCSFGNIISLISGVDLSPDNYNSNGNGVVYITGASNIVNGSLIVNRWTTSPKKIAKRGDILFTCKGTVGSVCILEIDEAHIARQIMAIRPLKVDIKFVLYYLQYEVNIIKKQAKSMIPGIERKNINNALFPLPPLAEQHRIVERLNELLPLCEAMKGQEE